MWNARGKLYWYRCTFLMMSKRSPIREMANLMDRCLGTKNIWLLEMQIFTTFGPAPTTTIKDGINLDIINTGNTPIHVINRRQELVIAWLSANSLFDISMHFPLPIMREADFAAPLTTTWRGIRSKMISISAVGYVFIAAVMHTQ